MIGVVIHSSSDLKARRKVRDTCREAGRGERGCSRRGDDDVDIGP